MSNHLIIGNKNYSSWSLRPWILMQVKQITFKETKIFLYETDSKAQILKYSPAGLVPYFENQQVKIWDSLAICEYLAESYPDKHCWPTDPQVRATARAISAEMHSGFSHIRQNLPMNCRKKVKFSPIETSLKSEIERVCAIWNQCLSAQSTHAKFLFGDFTIADAMFTPVVLRFHSYGIEVDEISQQYMQSILQLPQLQAWIAEGIAEKAIIQQAE